VFASARTGEGIDEVLERIAYLIPDRSVAVELLVPYEHGEVIAALHARGRVTSVEYTEQGTRVSARLDPTRLAPFEPYRLEAATHA
jgi:GTP-binding protein HflX